MEFIYEDFVWNRNGIGMLYILSGVGVVVWFLEFWFSVWYILCYRVDFDVIIWFFLILNVWCIELILMEIFLCYCILYCVWDEEDGGVRVMGNMVNRDNDFVMVKILINFL